MKKIVIIGAGISGMTAAMNMINKGYKVEIYESTNRVGGRCFSFFDKKNFEQINLIHKNKNLFEIDNGQHLFSGAYNGFFKLIKWLETENLFSENENLNVDFIEIFTQKNHTNIFKYRLDCTKPHNKFGLLIGFLKIKGIGVVDKFMSMNVFALILCNFSPRQDMSALKFLERIGISKDAIKKIWEPIIVSVMNAPIDKASTKLFLKVLKKLVFGGKNSLSLLYSKSPLSLLFKRFEDKINSSGNKICFNTIVSELIIENGICRGVLINGQEQVLSDFVISTLPPNKLCKINSQFEKYNTIFHQSPILSVYLWLNKPIITTKYLSCINTNIEWLFNKNVLLSLDSKIFQYAITISAASDLIYKNDDAILKIIISELVDITNDNEIEILAYRIIKDKSATSLITYTNQAKRPETNTAIENFYLAGDWIQTNLPATMESAAISGENAANAIISKQNM